MGWDWERLNEWPTRSEGKHGERGPPKRLDLTNRIRIINALDHD